jgi:hypothetical protein
MPLRARMGSPVVGEMVVMVSTDMVTDAVRAVRCGTKYWELDLLDDFICDLGI